MTASSHDRLIDSSLLLLVVFLFLVAPITALGETPLLPLDFFDLPRAERRSLEQAACRPLNRRLGEAYGIDSDDDRREYIAIVRCASHRSIDDQPVVYERGCERIAGWNCDRAAEVVMAAFEDRSVHVHLGGSLSLEETYAIVKHFVTRKLIEPPPIHEVKVGSSGVPLDRCEVHYRGTPNQYELDCHTERRQVLRTQSKGAVTYRQIPLPECATPDNPACVAEEE